MALPYRIYGGMRFFERQEVKDALELFTFNESNRSNDDAAFERVVNTPTRGLGDKTLDTVRVAARDNGSNHCGRLVSTCFDRIAGIGWPSCRCIEPFCGAWWMPLKMIPYELMQHAANRLIM